MRNLELSGPEAIIRSIPHSTFSIPHSKNSAFRIPHSAFPFRIPGIDT
ncbi:MAG TPA: hypothetical protein VGQ81_08885 [Acidobacteriota bacterium]|nr:hypothetical protein [Acidobacteriota bacterium]